MKSTCDFINHFLLFSIACVRLAMLYYKGEVRK